nr:hypothetical protein [Tanacetum cinerariifolium]
MSNQHKNWLVQKQTALGKDSLNPLMAKNLPKIIWYLTYHVSLMKSWLVQKQTALGKDSLNPLMAKNLPKIIWYLTYHVSLMKSWLVQKQTALGQTATGKEISNLFMDNDVTRLQALVDKKKVVITEASIREPGENVDSTSKFYMYPRFIQFLIRKQVGDLSTHTTKYTSPALTQKVFANMRRVGKGFSGVKTPLFEGMLVERVIEEGGNAEEHVKDVDGDAAQGDDIDVQRDDAQRPTIPSPTPPTPPPQPPQDLPSTSQRVGTSHRVDTSEDTMMDDASNQGRRIDELDKDDAVALMDDKEEDKKEEEVKEDKPAEVQEVVVVVTTAKLITKVVTVASETVTAANTIIFATEPQVPAATITVAPVRVAAASTRRMKGVVIRDPEEESSTSSIIPVDTKSKDKGKGIMVEEPKPLKKKQQVKMDKEYKRKLHAKLNKDIDWDVAIDHVKLDYFKGMSYDDIRPIFEVKFNSNVDFLLKKKEQMEEEESRALQSINETPAQKAAKRRKLNEEVKDLKRHLEIVPDEDDDVYTEATPLARKVPVVDYEIIHLNNKPYYKIIRPDGTHQWTGSSLEESKDYTWSSKGQELEATRIMWCAHHNMFNHIADFASIKKVKESSRKGQNQIKTGQKREAWRSREKSEAVTVERGRKTEENKKRMNENANTYQKLFKFKEKKKREGPNVQFKERYIKGAFSANIAN